MGNAQSDSSTDSVNFVSSLSDNDSCVTHSDVQFVDSLQNIVNASRTFATDNESYQAEDYVDRSCAPSTDIKFVTRMEDNAMVITHNDSRCSANDIIFASNYAANLYKGKEHLNVHEIKHQCASRMIAEDSEQKWRSRSN
jgi:hypothetical protein